MALLDLKFFPDQVLRSPTGQVVSFDHELHSFLDNMRETMESENGIGLAAPQVGVLKKIAVIDLSVETLIEPTIESLSSRLPQSHIHDGCLELLNPTIIAGEKKVSSEEGCLSIPDFRDSVMRHVGVTVEAVDRHGYAFRLTASKLLAYCIQHEVDHLNGVLFIDHLSPLKKHFFKKWCKKREIPDEVRLDGTK